MHWRARLGLCLGLAFCACRSARGEATSEIVDPRVAPEQRSLDAGESYMPPANAPANIRFTPRAHYRIAARVLSAERYYIGWSSVVLPIDLALGWSAMSDPAVDQWIDWHQNGRYYFWQWSAGSPYQNAAIRSQSASVHIAPGSKNLWRALLSLERGEQVLLEGWLVDIDGAGGEFFRTSLSRSDTGANSCEVLQVAALTRDGLVYR